MGVFALTNMMGVKEAEGMVESFLRVWEDGGDFLLYLREKGVFDN